MSTIKVDTYLTRGGASEIAIDKLKGVTAAGSILVVGEGGTTTTNLQQGLIKVWFYKETDGASLGDSFNVSSLTDTGTGHFSIVFANDFSNSKYGSGSNDVGVHHNAGESTGVQSVVDSTTLTTFKSWANGSLADYIVNGNFAGDLA